MMLVRPTPVLVRFAAVAVLLAMTQVAVSAARAQSVEDIVARTEPSVASIIVSRSDWYRKLKFTTGSERRGQLNGFEYSKTQIGPLLGLRIGGDDTLQALETHQHYQAKLDLAFGRHIPEAFGSGIIVDAKGLILTNYHVVQDATKVYVRWPGGKGSYANIWAADPRSDLAMLRLIDDVANLTPITFGNADDLRRGQQVIALANFYAAGQNDGQPSVSVGVLSNTRRRMAGRQPLSELNANPLYQFGMLLQTDARIALGSSGGPLVNMKGECVGILTSLAAIAGSDAPGGFAVPVNPAVRKIIETLKRSEEVEYGFLGVAVEADPASGGGVVVQRSTDGSPAMADASLQRGDVIVSIGSTPVRDNADLMYALGLCFAGERISIGVVRSGVGAEQKTSAKLVKYNFLSDKIIANSVGSRPYVEGLRVDYTSILAHARTTGRILPGVLVADVLPNSKAERLKLVKNMIITHVNSVPVSTPAAFYEQLNLHRAPVDLTIQSDGAIERVRW